MWANSIILHVPLTFYGTLILLRMLDFFLMKLYFTSETLWNCCNISPPTFYVVLVLCPGSQASCPQLSLHASSQNSCQCHCQTVIGRNWDGRPPDISQTAGALSTVLTYILMTCRTWDLYAQEYQKLLEIRYTIRSWCHMMRIEKISTTCIREYYIHVLIKLQLIVFNEEYLYIRNSMPLISSYKGVYLKISHTLSSFYQGVYCLIRFTLRERINNKCTVHLLTSFLPALFQTAVPAFVLYPEGISIPVSCTEMYTKKSFKTTRNQEFIVKDNTQ